jgi:hypothetical protein
MSGLSFHDFTQLTNSDSEQTFKAAMETSGYFSFYKFADEFRSGLKGYAETEIVSYGQYLDRAYRLFPKPEQFSPSWETLWNEYTLIYNAKNDVLQAILESDRAGEWQVLIDNPYNHQQVVCYPSLAYLEAAYMYGYFQQDLKPHENLRLQRVTNVLLTHGRKEASIFPQI